MGSLSFSMWFSQALVLLSLVLVRDSIALDKCYQCEKKDEPCIVKKCDPTLLTFGKGSTDFVCISTYDSSKTKKTKNCFPDTLMEKVIDGRDKCAKGVEGSKLIEQSLVLAYNAYRNHDPTFTQSEEDFIKEKMKQVETQGGTYVFPKQKYSMCSCSTDSCNSDEEDGKLLGERIPPSPDKKGKGKDKPKAKANRDNKASTPLGSGSHVAVIILALAAAVYGFLGV